MNPIELYDAIRELVKKDAELVAGQVYDTKGTQYGVADVPFHTHNGTDASALPFQNVQGFFQVVTSVPTIAPTSIYNQVQLYVTGGNYTLYIYDTSSNVWVSASVTDAHIRGLFSATLPIAYNNTTGIISTSPYISKAYLAGEAITANDAVCAAWYQSDGGIQVDTTASNQVIATSISAAITVGNNSNRIMVAVISYNNAISVTNVKYAAAGMTAIDSTVQGNCTIDTYYIIAPTTGTNNFTATISAATQDVEYMVYSLYNAKQSGQPAAHTTTTGTGFSTITLNITPAEIADFLIGYAGVSYSSGGPNSDDTLLYPTNSGAHQVQFLAASSSALTASDNGLAITADQQTIKYAETGTGGANKVVGAICIAPVTSVAYGYVKQASAKVASTYSAGAASTTFRASAFIGFALASAAVGASVTVILNGIATLSALLPPAVYYLANTEGTISTTNGSVVRKVGTAVTTTDLAIANEP